MQELEDIPNEFKQPIITCVNLMRGCVIIFDDGKPSWQTYCRHLLMIPSLALFYASVSVYMFQVLKEKLQLEEFAFAVGIYMICTQGILKIAVVASKKKEIRSIIFKLGRMWRDDLTEVQINKKNVLLKRLKFCYAAFYWMNVLGTVQYILAPLFETVFRKYMLQEECELLLPFPCSFPFNPAGSWPVYIAVYIFEIFSIFCVLYIYVGSEFLMITLCSHLATEFMLLQEDLMHAKPMFNVTGMHISRDKNREIKDIIKRHQKLIEFTEQLDFIFNKMIFVNLSVASITICLFAFSATVARRFVDMANNFLGVAALAVPIFNLCYYGELLREATSAIADAAYHNLWYNGGTQYGKLIWLIIKRSQKSCGLTSLKYNPITLGTFTTVMSTTWSYFSLALNLYEDDN